MTPPEQRLLDLEQIVKRGLNITQLAVDPTDRRGQPGRCVGYLLTQGFGHCPDPVPVHLLQPPEHPVGGPEHALECVPALVLSFDLSLQLANPLVGSVNHALTYLTEVLPNLQPSSLPEALRAHLNPVGAWGQFRPGARRAAVMALLHHHHGAWWLPFVQRRADLPDHPGQVALPGGVVKGGEDAWSAAAREVHEEVGVALERILALGAGEPVYTSVSNFCVVPFVGWVEGDVEFAHDPGELESVLEVPLADILDDSHWRSGAEPWMGRYFLWDGLPIWGLTERMMSDLLPRFRAALGG